MSLNEAVPGPSSSAFAENPKGIGRRLHAYDAFQVGFRNKLIEQGIEAVAFNFGAGNFATAKHYLDFFPNTLATYTYLGFHEYGWPALSTSVDPAARSSAGTYRGDRRRPAARRSAVDYRGHPDRGRPDLHVQVPGRAALTRGGFSYPPAEYHSAPLTQDQYWQSLEWLNSDAGAGCVRQGRLPVRGRATRASWINFRHFGTDNSGQPITIMERIKAPGAGQPEGRGAGAARGLRRHARTSPAASSTRTARPSRARCCG